MKTHHLTISYSSFDSIEELHFADRLLLEEAKKHVLLAYSPYSGFSVGAAVLLENDIIIGGNNQENAAYPSGLCAERVAIFSAAAQYPGIPFKAMAVTAQSATFTVDFPVSPCGACRQVLVEYENSRKSPIKIILQGETGEIVIFKNVADTLPFVFNAKQLQPK